MSGNGLAVLAIFVLLMYLIATKRLDQLLIDMGLVRTGGIL